MHKRRFECTVTLATHHLIDGVPHMNLVWNTVTIYGLPYLAHCIHHFLVINFPGIVVMGYKPCQGWHKVMLELITFVSTMREVVLDGSGSHGFDGLDQIIGISHLYLDHAL